MQALQTLGKQASKVFDSFSVLHSTEAPFVRTQSMSERTKKIVSPVLVWLESNNVFTGETEGFWCLEKVERKSDKSDLGKSLYVYRTVLVPENYLVADFRYKYFIGKDLLSIQIKPLFMQLSAT